MAAAATQGPGAYPPAPPTAAQLYAKALYDPRPTTTEKSEHRLAYALGYPADWRVERRVKVVVVIKSEDEDGEGPSDVKREDQDEREKSEASHAKDMPPPPPRQPPSEVEEKRDAANGEEAQLPQDEKNLPDLPSPEPRSSTPKKASVVRTQRIILDRIHATAKGGRKLLWFSHAHALKAAAHLAQLQAENKSIQYLPASYQSQLLPPEPRFNKGDTVQVLYNEDELLDEDGNGGDKKNKRKRKNQDGDVHDEIDAKNKKKGRKSKGEKKKEPQWYSAIITKRRRVGDEYVYSVFYPEDESTQSDVEDELLEPTEDPVTTAINLGFPEGWTATKSPPNRYRLTTPDGYIYTSLAAAKKYAKNLERKKKQEENKAVTPKKAKPKANKSKSKKKKKEEPQVEDETSVEIPPSEEEQYLLMQQQQIEMDTEMEQQDDPPWRTEDHPLLGRRVRWSEEHQVSARRTIHVEQEGEIVGFISKDDKDSKGDPGFTNSKGEPADLFHVVFSTQELNHPYAQHLLASQDLELYEVENNLLPEEVESDDDGDDDKEQNEEAEKVAAADKEKGAKEESRGSDAKDGNKSSASQSEKGKTPESSAGSDGPVDDGEREANVNDSASAQQGSKKRKASEPLIESDEPGDVEAPPDNKKGRIEE